MHLEGFHALVARKGALGDDLAHSSGIGVGPHKGSHRLRILPECQHHAVPVPAEYRNPAETGLAAEHRKREILREGLVLLCQCLLGSYHPEPTYRGNPLFGLTLRGNQLASLIIVAVAWSPDDGKAPA